MRRLEKEMKRITERCCSHLSKRLDWYSALMVMVLLAFTAGIYCGALITVRHAERKDVLEARCLKALPELNRAAAGLEARAQEVIREKMLLGNEVLQPGDQPGLQGVYKDEGGKRH